MSCKPLNFKDFISWFTIWREDNTWVASATSFNLFDIKLLKHLLTASRLLTLSHIRRETTDKLFKFFTLFFCFLILLLLLAKS